MKLVKLVTWMVVLALVLGPSAVSAKDEGTKAEKKDITATEKGKQAAKRAAESWKEHFGKDVDLSEITVFEEGEKLTITDFGPEPVATSLPVSESASARRSTGGDAPQVLPGEGQWQYNNDGH